MKKLILALLVAALCMVAPAIALDWDDLPVNTPVMVDAPYPPGAVWGTYFDLYFCENNGNGNNNGGAYPAWCVDTSRTSITEVCYCAHLSSTIGDEEWNKVNWVLNNKGEATFGEIQAAIWMIRNQPIASIFDDWIASGVAADLAANADPSFTPGCGDIAAVLVVACEQESQELIIEVPVPPCPPVPEFPTMLIPVFFVGSVLVAASVLKKE